MLPAEIIRKKRNGQALSRDELRFFIQEYTKGTLPEYQMAALLMAIYFQGMDHAETETLVELMLDSGERLHFGHLKAYVADKHSTGGVGDKVSLILGPLMAAAGLAIPMISGRGLGHTGGTLDKLETIPGFRTDLSLNDFRRVVEEVGIAMIGQTEDICPADKKMYALRDVTATVQSIPLICGSIMSKKIAEGIQGLVLDVKVGNGAFMTTLAQARQLAGLLVQIGSRFNLRTEVVYSSMNQPLGRFAGLWCEVHEALDCLQGQGPRDTMRLTYELGVRLLLQAGRVRSRQQALKVQKQLIDSGQAHAKFLEMVAAQKGSLAALEAPGRQHQPRFTAEIRATADGYLQKMDTYRLGIATVELGCGRTTTGDTLDPTAGLEFRRKTGDPVQKGEVLVRCFNSHASKLQSALHTIQTSIEIGPRQVRDPLIIT